MKFVIGLLLGSMASFGIFAVGSQIQIDLAASWRHLIGGACLGFITGVVLVASLVVRELRIAAQIVESKDGEDVAGQQMAWAPPGAMDN